MAQCNSWYRDLTKWCSNAVSPDSRCMSFGRCVTFAYVLMQCLDNSNLYQTQISRCLPGMLKDTVSEALCCLWNVFVLDVGEVPKAINSAVTVLCQAVISSCCHLIWEFSSFRTSSSLASCTVQWEARNEKHLILASICGSGWVWSSRIKLRFLLTNCFVGFDSFKCDNMAQGELLL